MHRSGSHALAEIIFEAKAFEEIEPTRSLHYTRKSFSLCVIVCVVASHRTLNSPKEMSAVDYRRSEHSFDPDCIHLVAHKEANIYGDFLDDFTVQDWVSQVAPETEFISPHADKASCLYSRSKSGHLAGNAVPSVVVGVESNSCASTAVSGISRTHFTASPETGFETISKTNRKEDVADAPGSHKAASVSNAIISYSSVRKLSSTTYLRRMHLSREDAVAFFPESKETMELIFATDMTRCISPEHFKVKIHVSLYDSEGKRWPVVLECLRSAGQRHVRLNKGWAEACRAIGLSVGKRIRLARWEQASSSKDAFVTVSTV